MVGYDLHIPMFCLPPSSLGSIGYGLSTRIYVSSLLFPLLRELATASPPLSMFYLAFVLLWEHWLWPSTLVFFLSVICQSLGNIGNGLSTPVYVLSGLCPTLGVSAMASHPCMFHPASVNHLGILAMTSLPWPMFAWPLSSLRSINYGSPPLSMYCLASVKLL